MGQGLGKAWSEAFSLGISPYAQVWSSREMSAVAASCEVAAELDIQDVSLTQEQRVLAVG